MDDEESVAYVLRVTRPDTIQVRSPDCRLGCMATLYLRLEGVECRDNAQETIIDWVELHADYGRLRLHTGRWLRDVYGRVLGDLADLSTGELLTDHLVSLGVATQYPNHYMDTLTELMHCREPDDVV